MDPTSFQIVNIP